MIEIYTGPSCGYCVRAKALLDKHGFEYKEINAKENRDALIERLDNLGQPYKLTIPQIWWDGEYVGGHDDLKAKLEAKLEG